MRRLSFVPLALLTAAFGPCQNTSAVDQAPSPPAQAAARASAEPLSPVAPPRKQQTLTVNARMKEHFAEGDLIRRALIVGDLPAAQRAGSSLASDEWTTNLRASWKPHVAAVQRAGKHVAEAPDLSDAARASAELAGACAGCHEQVGRPEYQPVALDSKASAMAVHAWAADNLWWGLFVPSDSGWKAGADALSGAALVLSDVPAVEAIATQVYETARRGQTASTDQRGRIFAELLTTCASCHRAVGAELTLGEVAPPHASSDRKRADEPPR